MLLPSSIRTYLCVNVWLLVFTILAKINNYISTSRGTVQCRCFIKIINKNYIRSCQFPYVVVAVCRKKRYLRIFLVRHERSQFVDVMSDIKFFSFLQFSLLAVGTCIETLLMSLISYEKYYLQFCFINSLTHENYLKNQSLIPFLENKNRNFYNI